MLWIKAFHIIAMVAWFAGLLYLPRLFVYHSTATDKISQDRFVVMEHKLYYYIMHPAMLATLALGAILAMSNWPVYQVGGWFHAKLLLVIFVMIYHLYCGRLLKQFKVGKNTHSDRFYRYLNEIPTVLLIGIVILVVVRPF